MRLTAGAAVLVTAALSVSAAAATNAPTATRTPAFMHAGIAADARTAADAPAGTVAVTRACYVNTASAAAKITVTGAGWQAGEPVELTDALGRISATATTGSDGTFTTTVPAPVVDSYRALQITDTIEASYAGTPSMIATSNGPTAVSQAFLTTNFAVLLVHTTRGPVRRTTFELSGFAPNRPVYGHYLDRSGRWLANVSFGRPTGACGLRRVTADEYPGGHPRKGTYTIQFDRERHYSKLATPQYRVSFDVSS